MISTFMGAIKIIPLSFMSFYKENQIISKMFGPYCWFSCEAPFTLLRIFHLRYLFYNFFIIFESQTQFVSVKMTLLLRITDVFMLQIQGMLFTILNLSKIISSDCRSELQRKINSSPSLWTCLV